MSKSSTTVREVFELPEPGAEGSDNWKTFKSKVSNEVKGIKTAAMPDLAKKVAELFEIPIPDIFLTSWKKAGGIQTLLEESRKAPETAMHAELGDHTINSQHRPHIEIRIQNKSVKKLEFTLNLVFNLKGFVLKIQDGRIREMQTGSCEVRGKMEYQGLVIADKKLAPITLPGVISLERLLGAPEKEKTVALDEKPASLQTAPEETLAANSERVPIPEPVEIQAKQKAAQIEQAANAVRLPTVVKEEDLIPGLNKLAAPEGVRSEVPIAEPTAVAESAPGAVVIAEEKGKLPASEPDAASAHPTPGASEQAEERMTWEVGDDDEHIEPKPAETSGKIEIDENAEDIISQMSRELSEKRQSSPR